MIIKWKKKKKASAVVIGLTVVSAVLSGCAGDHADLQTYVNDVISRQKPRIKPLPEFKPYPVFKYEIGDRRDPFEEEAFSQQRAEARMGESGIVPDRDRQKEPLEEYPLDTLRMVGTLEQKETLWALIKDGEGSIHRVTAGNYLGRNDGKIVSVTEHRIELKEIVPDGTGAYMERDASIALSESQ